VGTPAQGALKVFIGRKRLDLRKEHSRRQWNPISAPETLRGYTSKQEMQ